MWVQISPGWIRVKIKALACVREWTWWVRTIILTTTVLSWFTMLTGPDSGAAMSATRRRINWSRQCVGYGWAFLSKNNIGPELFTMLTMICMDPLVAGRKWWEKKTGRYLCLRIISTECNDTLIGNNILLLKFDFSNHEFKERVHEHLALFIYLLIYV